MAVTSQQILDFLLANPGMSDAEIASAMQTYNVTPAQMAQAVGLPVEEVQTRYNEAAPSVYTAENVNKLADQILSQGTTEAWTGGLPPEKAALYMADELAKSGVTDITQVAKGDDGIINSMTGEKLISGYGERTGGNLWSGSYEGKGNTGFGVNFDESGKPVFYTQGASSSTLKEDVLKAAAVAALAFGIPGVSEGLFTGAGTAAGAAGTAGMTAAELAQLDLALGGAGGTVGATELAAALATGAPTVATTSLTGGSGLITGANAGITAESVAAKLAADAAASGTGLLTNVPSVTTATGALTPAATTATGALTPAATTAATTAATSALNPLVKAAIPAVTGALSSTLTPTNLSNLFSGALGTTGNLLQMQASKEAALAAQQRIDAETAAAKQAAAFTPVGMTTRFGSSQFQVDPTTGRLTSAGYTLSPEAKAAQDRFVKLAEQGIQQAEGAQAAFAPLQTGAQSLFSLGNQYLAQSPEQVAQNYLNQQMALLQPGRELELANLQNKLQQQGRGGLSVAQGGNLGATTPELQALFNARAQQEALLAAQAQQAGQQQVTFGAGLLGQGANAMGQYYGGQTAAYQPYTTALGQVQALEAAGQQPLTMGAQLGQTAAQAGANVGQLGLKGAGFSTALATSANATANPYAQLLGAAGNPNAMFGSTINSMLGGLFGGTAPVNALDSSAYGTGTAGFQNMLNDIYG